MTGQRIPHGDEALVHPLTPSGSIDFPFQKNIHQLPQDEFIDCLYDLYFAPQQRGARLSPRPSSGRATSRRCSTRASVARSPRSSSSRTTRSSTPATSRTLDKDAMGRFFPHADLTDIIRNMREPDNASYNATFTYPEGGAIEYVKALASEVPGVADRAGRAAGARSTSSAGGAHDQARDSASSASSRRRRSRSSCSSPASRTTRPCSPGTRCSCSTSASTGRGRATCTGSTTRTARACSIGSASTTTSSTPIA